MAFSLESLSPALQGKLAHLAKNGKLEISEVGHYLNAHHAEFTNAELKELSPLLAGEPEKPVDQFVTQKKVTAQADKPQEKKSNVAGYVVTGLGLVGGIAAAIVGAPVLAVGGLCVAALGLTSCSKGDDTYINMEGDNVNATVNINWEGSIQDIVNGLIKNLGDKLDDILQELKTNNRLTSEAIAELLKHGVKLDAILAALADQTDVLNQLAGGMSSITNTLEDIAAMLKQNPQNPGFDSTILQKILDAIESLKGESGSDKTTLETLLNAILAKMTEAMEHNESMHKETKALLQSIIDKLGNLDANMRASVERIIAKMSDSDTKLQAMLKTVIDAIKSGDKNNQEFFTKVLDKIENITVEGGGTNPDNSKVLELLQKIVENQDKYGKEAADRFTRLVEILDKLGGSVSQAVEVLVNLSGTFDPSKIEDLLEQLLAQSKTNGDKLNDIDVKLGAIETTLSSLRVYVEQNAQDNKDILAKLDEILDAIKNHKCECKVDLSVVVELLQQIVDGVENGKGNEGVLGALDGLQGSLG